VRLMLLGHGRHGKDTVAEILNRKYGLTFQSSSLGRSRDRHDAVLRG
jgi:hypothetical protein